MSKDQCIDDKNSVEECMCVCVDIDENRIYISAQQFSGS